MKKNEPQLDSVGEDAVIKDAAGGNRSRDQKGKALKEKVYNDWFSHWCLIYWFQHFDGTPTLLPLCNKLMTT